LEDPRLCVPELERALHSGGGERREPEEPFRRRRGREEPAEETEQRRRQGEMETEFSPGFDSEQDRRGQESDPSQKSIRNRYGAAADARITPVLSPDNHNQPDPDQNEYKAGKNSRREFRPFVVCVRLLKKLTSRAAPPGKASERRRQLPQRTVFLSARRFRRPAQRRQQLKEDRRNGFHWLFPIPSVMRR
jgi:hypothetical protein